MKIAGIKCIALNNVSKAQKTNNVQKNNSLNFFGTKPLNTLSQDTVSFGMKGSGKVNDVQDLIAYVGKNNATKIFNILKKCRYSKADILTSGRTKCIREDGKMFLTNFNSIDHDDKFYGNCQELMLKAGKGIKEECPDLNVYGVNTYNADYRMSHCVLLVAKKDSLQDFAIQHGSIDPFDDTLFVDPSFRTFEMKQFSPIDFEYRYRRQVLDIDVFGQDGYNKIELKQDEPIIMGNYDDIAQELNLPSISGKFSGKPPLLAIYKKNGQIEFTMAGDSQNAEKSEKRKEIEERKMEFAKKQLLPFAASFLHNL